MTDVERCWTIATEADGDVRVEIRPRPQWGRIGCATLWSLPIGGLAVGFCVVLAGHWVSVALDGGLAWSDWWVPLVAAAIVAVFGWGGWMQVVGWLVRIHFRETVRVRPGRVTAERSTVLGLGRRTGALPHPGTARVFVGDSVDLWFPPTPTWFAGRRWWSRAQCTGVPPFTMGRVEIAVGTPGSDDVTFLRVGFGLSPEQAHALVRDLDGIHGLRAVSGLGVAADARS